MGISIWQVLLIVIIVVALLVVVATLVRCIGRRKTD